MSLGFAPCYEPSELDEIEAMVTPLAETLVSKVEDMVLPQRGGWSNESDGHLSLIYGQMSALLYLKNRFVVSFCLIELAFLPFCI